MNTMVSLFYHVGKGIERLSSAIGAGRFEVKENWKCIECAHRPDSELCVDCRASWLNEIAHLDYSDAFERRINIMVGTAAISMGSVAFLANVCNEFWVFGGAAKSIKEAFKAAFPFFLNITNSYRQYYNFLLAIFFVSAAIILVAGFMVPCFLMVINPGSNRHWKHMTPSAYVLMFAQIWIYVALFYVGVTVQDLIWVWGPIVVGNVGLGAVLCMKKSQDEMGVVKVDWEKMV